MSEIERAFDPETHSAILRAAELAYETSPDDGTALERAVIAAVHTAEQHRGKQEPVGYEVNFRTFGSRESITRRKQRHSQIDISIATSTHPPSQQT